jgi:P-type conjugative transfer protein TrbL
MLLPRLETILSMMKSKLPNIISKQKKSFWLLLSLFCVLGFWNIVFAQEDGYNEAIEISKQAAANGKVTIDGKTMVVGGISEGGAFTAYMNDMVTFAKKAISAMSTPVKSLLGSLILIDFVFVASQWAFGNQNKIGDLFWRFIRWGIFVWIIGDFTNLAETFLNGFMTIGSALGGGEATLLKQPSNIFTAFYASTVQPLLKYVFEIEYNFAGSAAGVVKAIMTFQTFPVIALCTFFLALFQLVLIVLIAATVVSTVAIFWFCAAIGFIFFPFMLLEQTRFLSGNVISALMSNGVRLAMLSVVLGLGNGIIVSAIKSFTPTLSGGDGILTAALLVTAFLSLFCWAAIKIPSVVAAAVAGGSGGGMGIAGGITKLATLGR